MAPEAVVEDMVVQEVGEDMAEEVVMVEAEAVGEVGVESYLLPFSRDTTLNTVTSPHPAVFPPQPSMSTPIPFP